MLVHARRVRRRTAAALEILFVLIDRLGNNDRAAIVFTVAGLSARDLARQLDRSPVVEDMLASGAS